MKKILTILLLCCSLSAFSQDITTYEVLPECFFEVEKDFIHIPFALAYIERGVGVDTCETSDVITPWPLPVNGYQSLMEAYLKRHVLIQKNKVFSNAFIEITDAGSSELTKMPISFDVWVESKVLDSTTVRQEYIAVFKELKKDMDSIAENQIFAYDYMPNEKGEYVAKWLMIKFEKWVSFKKVQTILSKYSMNIHDMLIVPPVSVHEDTPNGVEIRQNSILFNDVQQELSCKIFDLSGCLIKEESLSAGMNQTIDISGIRQGVYFLQFANQRIKFIKE